jgi:lipopolysaccharide export system permease protein
MEKRSVHAVRFDAYDIRLDVAGAVSAAKDAVKTHKEMTLGELRQFLSSGGEGEPGHHAALLELHRKFAIPVACFALGILAVRKMKVKKTTFTRKGVTSSRRR